MRIYDVDSVCKLYLSPYCVLSICSNAIRLDHRLSNDFVLLHPHSVPLQTLWDRLNRGGTEADWRLMLETLIQDMTPSLEELIQRGFLE